jgi:hypothetical protein
VPGTVGLTKLAAPRQPLDRLTPKRLLSVELAMQRHNDECKDGRALLCAS